MLRVLATLNTISSVLVANSATITNVVGKCKSAATGEQVGDDQVLPPTNASVEFPVPAAGAYDVTFTGMDFYGQPVPGAEYTQSGLVAVDDFVRLQAP